MAPDPTRFILVRPRHPGNVGATARAMKVMGFSDLVLVSPPDPGVLARDEARALASGAVDVLEAARVVGGLDEALDGIHCACATAMTPRDFGPPTASPRAGLPPLAAQPLRLAFVFGEERVGLSNEDLYRCHQVLSIPTAPGYGSLNLAQSVQLIAYEWREALGGFPVRERTADDALADARAVQGLVDHWRGVLERIDFLDPASPKKLMVRLQRLLLRARPRQTELHILRGIARAVDDAARAMAPSFQQPQEPLATLARRLADPAVPPPGASPAPGGPP